MTFPELAVPADLLTALARAGISEPTPIQAAALPLLMAGRDAYLHAETGTGKTLAYVLPLFCRIDTSAPALQTIILAPTHELAIQIQRQCTELAQHAGRALRTVLLVGGTPLDRQLDKLKKKPHLVVGTPGRIRELLEMRKLKLQQLHSIVIDEADRLLGSESLPHVAAVIAAAPASRQLIFVSATEDREHTARAMAFAPQLTMVHAAAAAVNPHIAHYYVVCAWRDKPDMIRKLFHALNPDRAMVFVHRNETAAQVAARLAQHQIPTADLSGSTHKLDRKQAMDDFRRGTVRVLLASDVAARGLDIQGVTHVINLDPPTESKAYLHRVGRTGRAGAEGTAISLLTDDELRLVARYQSELGIHVEQVRVREGRVTVVAG